METVVSFVNQLRHQTLTTRRTPALLHRIIIGSNYWRIPEMNWMILQAEFLGG